MNVLILTPLALEANAILKHLKNVTTVSQDGHHYEVGQYIGKYHSYKIIVRQTGSKNSDVAIATEKAVQYFQPSIIILTGVAGGVKDVDIGDIVVANKAYGYESGKQTNEGHKARPEAIYYSQDLLEFAQSISKKDNWRIRSSFAKSSNIYFGAIASGNKVIASTKSAVYKQLKNHFNDTLALEMEAIGFAKAMLNYPLKKFINIRGISDLLNDKSQSDREGHQHFAATNAAAFVFEMLDTLDYSKLNIPSEILDMKLFIKDLYSQVLPLIQLEAGQDVQISKDHYLSMILKKIKPLVEEEYSEMITDFQDEDNHAVFRNQLKKQLQNNNQLTEEVSTLLSMCKKQQSIHTKIIKSKNVISGSTIRVGGDFHLGDQKEKENTV